MKVASLVTHLRHLETRPEVVLRPLWAPGGWKAEVLRSHLWPVRELVEEIPHSKPLPAGVPR